jgi:hypothetical protein
LIDPQRDSWNSTWTKDGQALVSPEDVRPRLQIPHSIPEAYGLELVASRRSGDDAFVIGLAAGGRQATLIVDQRWDRGTALGYIDGKPPHETETARATCVFTDREPRRVLVMVRPSHITMALDGRLLVDWRGGFDRLSLSPLWTVADEKALFVGCFRSSFAISRMQLVPLFAEDTAPETDAESTPSP